MPKTDGASDGAAGTTPADRVHPEVQAAMLEDPAGRPIDEIRRTRDEIDRRVHDLIAELNNTSPRPGSAI